MGAHGALLIFRLSRLGGGGRSPDHGTAPEQEYV